MLPLATAVILVASLTTAVAAGAATQAHAGLLDATCTTPSSQTATYSPPLTDTSQPVTVTHTGTYGPCVSLSEPGLTSGTVNQTVDVPGYSCNDLLSSGPNDFTIDWNTGKASTITGEADYSEEDGVLTVTTTGTVTSATSWSSKQATGLSNPITLCALGEGTISSTYETIELEITSA